MRDHSGKWAANTGRLPVPSSSTWTKHRIERNLTARIHERTETKLSKAAIQKNRSFTQDQTHQFVLNEIFKPPSLFFMLT